MFALPIDVLLINWDPRNKSVTTSPDLPSVRVTIFQWSRSENNKALEMGLKQKSHYRESVGNHLGFLQGLRQHSCQIGCLYPKVNNWPKKQSAAVVVTHGSICSSHTVNNVCFFVWLWLTFPMYKSGWMHISSNNTGRKGKAAG